MRNTRNRSSRTGQGESLQRHDSGIFHVFTQERSHHRNKQTSPCIFCRAIRCSEHHLRGSTRNHQMGLYKQSIVQTTTKARSPTPAVQPRLPLLLFTKSLLWPDGPLPTQEEASCPCSPQKHPPSCGPCLRLLGLPQRPQQTW